MCKTGFVSCFENHLVDLIFITSKPWKSLKNMPTQMCASDHGRPLGNLFREPHLSPQDSERGAGEEG